MAVYGSGNSRGCYCAHFGWNRINFLKVAALELHFAFVVGSVLKSRGVFVTAGWSSHKVKAFAAPCPVMGWLGVHKGLGGDTADPRWPRYSIGCGIPCAQCVKLWEQEEEGWWTDGICLHKQPLPACWTLGCPWQAGNEILALVCFTLCACPWLACLKAIWEMDTAISYPKVLTDRFPPIRRNEK